MEGDQGSTGQFIDVWTQRGGAVLHRQVERRGDRIFMRIKKMSVLDLMDL